MKLFTILLAPFTILLFSCTTNTSNQKGNSDTMITEMVVDSTVLREEKIALGNINFGITEKEFNQERNSFLKKVKKLAYEDKELGYKQYHYLIGDYSIRDEKSITGQFYKDKLYRVDAEGTRVHYDYYETVLKELETLKDIFEAKYGTPAEAKPILNWHVMNDGDSYRIYTWKVGRKTIVTYITDDEPYFAVDFAVYDSAVAEEASNEYKKKEEHRKDSLKNEALKVLK